jgi:hypothetical protein
VNNKIGIRGKERLPELNQQNSLYNLFHLAVLYLKLQEFSEEWTRQTTSRTEGSPLACFTDSFFCSWVMISPASDSFLSSSHSLLSCLRKSHWLWWCFRVHSTPSLRFLSVNLVFLCNLNHERVHYLFCLNKKSSGLKKSIFFCWQTRNQLTQWTTTLWEHVEGKYNAWFLTKIASSQEIVIQQKRYRLLNVSVLFSQEVNKNDRQS